MFGVNDDKGHNRRSRIGLEVRMEEEKVKRKSQIVTSVNEFFDQGILLFRKKFPRDPTGK